MIIWLMFAMAVGVGASLLTGTAEMSFLGSHVSQSPVGPVFDVIVTWGEEGFVSAATLTFTQLPAVFGAFVNALVFNYAVLGANPTTGDPNILGLLARVVLVSCVTLPVLFGFFVEVAPKFIPGFGR